MHKEDVEETPPEVPAEDGSQDAPAAEAEPVRDEEPLEKAERERDEYLVNWQRARADFQNLKRRTLEDIEIAVSRERSAVLEESLTVLDYLDMALAAPCEGQEAKNLLLGVKMTRDHLWSTLERQQVKPIDTDGAFDPSRHQAVSTVETDDVAPGDVVEVVRQGFIAGDRVLRFAQVKVAAVPGSSEEAEQASEPEPVDEETPEDS